MKELNKTATKTFLKILEMMGEKTNIKIDNTDGVFMPLHVDFLMSYNIKDIPCKVYAFAHYYKQNGDLVPDPDMQFYIFEVDGVRHVFPATYQDYKTFQEALYITYETQEYKVNNRLQSKLTDFANIWMRNIKRQQSI